MRAHSQALHLVLAWVAMAVSTIVLLSSFGNALSALPREGPQELSAQPRSAFGFANVVFTGHLGHDFGGGPVYVNSNASAWGATNTIASLYAAYNSTYLFLGFNETISANSLMVLVGNGAGGGQATYNLAGLNAWGRDITLGSSIVDLAGVYFGGTNTQLSGYGVYQVLTPPSDSNTTPSDREVGSLSDFSAANDVAEIAIPLSTIFPANSNRDENVTVSAFVVGSTGSWVGTGVPYLQTGQYNAGGSQATFLVNDTIRFALSGVPLVAAEPVNVAIIFNDHQPVYEIAGQSTFNLPWTEAHATAEYMEQAVILHQFPEVNITYELSGSLLWQLQNISSDPSFNDSWIQGAYDSYVSLNTTQNRTLLGNLTGDWFSIPGYVFAFPEPAAQLYQQLDSRWSSGYELTATQYEDAKVLWFLYEISTDLVEGRLGSAWMSPTIWALHNQTSFDQADLGKILRYSQWLTGQVIPSFWADMLGNPSGSDNTELFTSPFYHPLTPLLLAPGLTGPAGTLPKGVYTSDVLAQMNLSRDQFDQMFGQYPRGLYASELAISEPMVPLINASGATWSLTDEWTLQQSGVPALAWGNSGPTVAGMEDLYTPYVVEGANGTTTDLFFRDASLSNSWAFDLGDLPTWTAIDDIVNYLKGVDATIPVGDHTRTLVTLALDGENWQFLSPFADDGVPFLEGLYTALEQNASFIHTETPTQFLDSVRSSPLLLPTLGSVATGSWNQGSGGSAPYQSNPSLTQWSGYNTQNWMWIDLDRVRAQVVSFQQKYGLTQIENLTVFDQELTANTAEGNVTRAWYGIYNAEGSDWFFQMAPWTISGANTVPFNLTFQGDLAYALSELHPLAPPPPPPRPVTVTFSVEPRPCDEVSFNDTEWANGTLGKFLPGNFTAQAPNCPGYSFEGWSITGILELASPSVNTTRVDVLGNGSLTASYRSIPIPPPPATRYLVSIFIDPAACSSIDLNGTSQGNDSSASFLQGNFSLTAPACVRYSFSGWVASRSLNVQENTSTTEIWVRGNGTLTADYVVLVNSPGSQTKNSPSSSQVSPLEIAGIATLAIAGLLLLIVILIRRRGVRPNKSDPVGGPEEERVSSPPPPKA